MQPETRYARSGDVRIAFQVVGNGPFDLVFIPGFISNLEIAWESPARARFFSRLSSFSRLILFDKRGTGLSDRVSPVQTLEEGMDDVRAVMDAAGCERAALFGVFRRRGDERAVCSDLSRADAGACPSRHLQSFPDLGSSERGETGVPVPACHISRRAKRRIRS